MAHGFFGFYYSVADFDKDATQGNSHGVFRFSHGHVIVAPRGFATEAESLLSVALIHEVMCVLGFDHHAFAHFRDERKRQQSHVRIYTAQNVREKLQEAQRDFIRASVGVSSKGRLLVPKMLHCFAKAFMDDANLAVWILPATVAFFRSIHTSDTYSCLTKFLFVNV